jgi:hypothetical protein
VARVEAILAAASTSSGASPRTGSRPTAEHALSICACVTSDDAPTWLIYDTDGPGIAWCRVPEGAEPLGLVDARLTAGGHADPAEILRWLEGQRAAPRQPVGSRIESWPLITRAESELEALRIGATAAKRRCVVQAQRKEKQRRPARPNPAVTRKNERAFATRATTIRHRLSCRHLKA